MVMMMMMMVIMVMSDNTWQKREGQGLYKLLSNISKTFPNYVISKTMKHIFTCILKPRKSKKTLFFMLHIMIFLEDCVLYYKY